MTKYVYLAILGWKSRLSWLWLGDSQWPTQTITAVALVIVHSQTQALFFFLRVTESKPSASWRFCHCQCHSSSGCLSKRALSFLSFHRSSTHSLLQSWLLATVLTLTPTVKCHTSTLAAMDFWRQGTAVKEEEVPRASLILCCHSNAAKLRWFSFPNRAHQNLCSPSSRFCWAENEEAWSVCDYFHCILGFVTQWLLSFCCVRVALILVPHQVVFPDAVVKVLKFPKKYSLNYIDNPFKTNSFKIKSYFKQ